MDDSPHATLKQCTGPCEQFLPVTTDFFYMHKRYGLSSKCKTCVKAYMKSKYEPHPETDKQIQERWARRSESARNSEKARLARERLADSRRGKPRKPFSDPEQHSANMSKSMRGIKHNVKPRIKFQPLTHSIQLDLPIFDGCEPKDYTEIDEVMSVYAIINAVTGKMYIGSAVDTKQRWYVHRWQLERGEHHSSHLQHAWNKDGAGVFSFRLLEIVEMAAMLIPREQYWIEHYCTFDSHYGYNISPTAGSPLGVRHSPEARAHMKASKQGFVFTPEISAMGAEKRRQQICKLTENDVIAIIERLALGESVLSIARYYSISFGAIYGIKLGKSWKHIPRLAVLKV